MEWSGSALSKVKIYMENKSSFLGSDKNLTVLQILLLLAVINIVGSILYWVGFGEVLKYVIWNIPTSFLLFIYSFRILREERPKLHYITARLATIIAVLLLIPKFIFYFWFGWQLGLFG